MRALVTAQPKGAGLWWPVRGELVCDANGKQLYIAPLGGKYRNISDADLADADRAARAYLRYRKQKHDETIREITIDPAGDAEQLGEITHIIYLRWNGKSYIHKFRARPRLLEFENRQLWIVGGRYRVGPAGIVG